MRRVALLCALLLTACGKADLYAALGIRKFAVGDCLIMSRQEPESWEVSRPKYKVLAVGKSKYLIEATEGRFHDEISFGHLYEDFYQKVPCK
jgi:hypothetical protein